MYVFAYQIPPAGNYCYLQRSHINKSLIKIKEVFFFIIRPFMSKIALMNMFSVYIYMCI